MVVFFLLVLLGFMVIDFALAKDALWQQLINSDFRTLIRSYSENDEFLSVVVCCNVHEE